ncbi:MAG: hypothetical protein AW09_001624 [Candidatus Accumulibacter phosphatis]|jgi:type III restriction enzyme|uniref:Uncharacterized protein n=2 Tax=Candidatus Accumulibacter TaxID=327159 RepID=A0A080LYU1_9PROT|nr:MAG: hypothetical protein AW09_001624 [Candidatus Accumulibacter phosphatis]
MSPTGRGLLECPTYQPVTSLAMLSADNPILNSPYDEPARHYATDAQGNLNYRDIRPGRRLFTPDVPQVPIGQQNQGSMFDLNDFQAEYGEHLINRLRDELRTWRDSGYRGVTSRVTRDLLDYWFANPERAAHQKLFFAQQEAVEAAIWLNEVAEKSNTGTHLQSAAKMAGKWKAERTKTRCCAAFSAASRPGAGCW